ncbi:AAA domain-containing protein [Nocardia brasiliensis]|uniref:AAA domain-containing protein n=1 Tax=Nocardia brasiliensis TaxID=37326 RepID=UPI0024576BB0|nr:AAA domain-containing protein [Nocardia brasiliensis]
MDDTDDRHLPDDDAVRRDAIKLVEYAREAAISSRSEVLDVEGYLACWWLSELPGGLELRAAPSTDGSVLKVPYRKPPLCPTVPEPLRKCLSEDMWTDPQVSNSEISEQLKPEVDNGTVRATTLNSALALRESWIGRLDADRPYRTFYENLRDAAHKLDTRDDEFELVLCSGLFAGTGPKAETIRRHLLVKRCWVRVDKKSSAVLVGPDQDVPMQLEDRRFLVEVLGERLQHASELRDQVAESDLLPHNSDELARWLNDWSHRMLPESPAYSTALAPPQPRGDKTAAVSASPALILRLRDRSSVAMFYEQILELLRSGRAAVPLGLLQLLHTPDEGQQRAWQAAIGTVPDSMLSSDPLFHKETNTEQREVLDRVRRFSGAVVQGPPGTGKTHTIANLLGAMLADGLRVLVVSQREQPLRVLRDKLPEDMRSLCVSMASKRGSDNGLETSVRDMSARLSRTTSETVDAEVKRLGAQRHAVQAQVEALTRQLAELLRVEHTEHPPVSVGYGGLLADIAEAVTDHAEQFGWFPPLPSTAPTSCPISPSDLHELLALGRAGLNDPARAAQYVPDAELLPAPSAVAAAIRSMTLPAQDEVSGQLADRLAALPTDTVLAWRDSARRVLELAEHLYQVASQRIPSIETGTNAALAGFAVDAWNDVLSNAGVATDLDRRLRAPAVRDVRCTAQLPEQWAAVRSQASGLLHAAEQLTAGLERGELLRNKVLRTATPFGKATAVVRQTFTFQGAEPTTAEAASAVAEYLEVLVGMSALDRVWQYVTDPWQWDSDVFGRLAQRREIEPQLAVLQELSERTAAIRSGLSTTGVLAILSDMGTWRVFADAAGAALERHQGETARKTYAEWLSQWRAIADQSDSASECKAVAVALEAQDPDDYRVACDGLASVRHSIAGHRRYRDLLEILRAAHPQLASEIDRTCCDTEWDGRIAHLGEAWSWGVADRFLRSSHRPDLVGRREADLVAAKASLRKVTAELATELAWEHCLKKMTPEEHRALKHFEVLAQKQGPGRGNYTADYRRAAKKAMRVAREAVPAWVMPIPKVAELILAQPNSFDVVIVDEASQAAMTSIFLLWLAPRIVVVGDDKQCAPQSSVQSLGKMQQRLHSDFPHVEEYKRLLLLPNGNLYNILGCAFPNAVTLREHFRCMPEIIEWPSQEFYGGHLVPLRQYGANRLEPVVIERVANGLAQGANEKMVNQLEAEHIVSTLVACFADPTYAGKTFGVIALRSRAQRQLIQHLLLQHISPEEIDRRELTVGSAAEFQGDERDVMIVSTVASGGTRQMRQDNRYLRDLNVAVSRARDQLRITTSLADDDLGPDDIRRKMLSHYQNTRSLAPRPSTREYPADTLRPPFTSLFPQRVYRALLERGFHASPHVTVGKRELDIVVYGNSGAVAVVCDHHTGASAEDTERDAESLRELHRAGWPFHRIAHSQFLLDQESALAPLWQMLDQHDVRPIETSEV